MKRLVMALFAGLAVATASARAANDDTVEIRAQEYPVACVAKIIEIEKKAWSVEAYPVGIMAAGRYVVVFRFVEPASYAGQVRRMGAYTEKDFTIDGRRLREGDTISFTAFQEILDQAVEPDVFSNLQQIKLEKEKGAANKAVPYR